MDDACFSAFTPVEVFQNFCGRRAGIVKALTDDVDKFYQLCDPDKENLCLYGRPNETWEVTLPTEEVPSELPDPTLGINFARDGMDKKDWLSLVAARSDSWLLEVAFYFGAMFQFNKDARRRLFQMINTLPSVFEEINAPAKKQSKEKTPKTNSKRHKLNSEMSHQPEPLTPVEVFQNFCGRRAGIVKALTNDVDKFYRLCDPNKENLCLYGHLNETWEVTLPTEEVPSELPEPTLGINFARDGMDKKDWLSLVAARSDSWLLAVAFYFGAMFGFNKDARRRLFQMINALPSVFEEINAPPKKQSKEKTGKSNSKRHKLNLERSHQPESQTKTSGALPQKEADDSGDKDGEEREVCGACGNDYAARNFWVCCKFCKQWFHGKCVRITPCQGGEYEAV